jgi:hypothetical protein
MKVGCLVRVRAARKSDKDLGIVTNVDFRYGTFPAAYVGVLWSDGSTETWRADDFARYHEEIDA